MQSACELWGKEVGTGAGEQVNRMMNGTGLTLGPFTGSGASRGGGMIMGTETCVNSELAEVVEGLQSVTEGGLVRRTWVDGSEERMWKCSLRIYLGQWRPDKRKVMEFKREQGLGFGGPRIAVSGSGVLDIHGM